MIELTVKFVPQAEIAPELQNEIDALDKLAFHSDSDEENTDTSEFGNYEIRWEDIRWASSEWMALGCVDDVLVTILCLLRREILVGEERHWVVGVGGVATHPDWQKRGLSTRLLQASETFMREKLPAAFGLLICGEDRLVFYERVGWRRVADRLFFMQDGKRYPIYQVPVMVLPLYQTNWPSGEIDLCGSPW